MTLEELKAADDQIKLDMGQRMYLKLVTLYCDQYGADASAITSETFSKSDTLSDTK